MSEALFIVGYYRSGTSALSGALTRLGVKMFNEADPNEHNPLGFYEIPELIEYDVDLFSRLGVEWTDVRGLPAGWAERADLASFAARLEEIIRRRFNDDDKVWGLKHPHLCRTLPLYERAARQAGHTPHIVHIFRDPWTAAASQRLKNGLSRAHALLLWMGYITSGERAARHLPRSWVTYHDLLTQPGDELRRIEQDTGIALSGLTPEGYAAAAAYLTAQLNRSEPLAHDDLAPPLRDLVGRAWTAILARDVSPATWDGFAAETADLAGFLSEMGASRGRVIPAFGGGLAPVVASPSHGTALRPPERADEGARRRLLARRDAGPALPRLSVVLAAPAGRAHALNTTLASLDAQWQRPDRLIILSADQVTLPGREVETADSPPGAITARLCARLNEEAARADYVAVLNAGDTLSPDACLRFALAAGTAPDLIYCDEIVPREGRGWVRHKPGWDITRLRQSAYLGDWVWYRGASLRRIGGFDANRAGAEEYDAQLRLTEIAPKVVRLPEALFTRDAQSRRDDIPATDFCARAAASVTAHLSRAGLSAAVQNRQHLGLFHHLRRVPDPGTTMILLCDGAAIADLDRWVAALLSGPAPSGPVILAGACLSAPVARYLTAVTEQQAALEGKVLAVPPAAGSTSGQVLGRALDLAGTELVAILDARAQPAEAHWAAGLRARLADQGIAMAAARALVPLAGGNRQLTVQGPIITGADTRLGAGHLADDPGPGGWLMVDQEASAITPPALLARRAALAACAMPASSGDSLWIELGAQLRARGARLVWTPDVSFLAATESGAVDQAQAFRHGAAAARALPWADAYHHPALSLHGDLLASEQRLGLVAASPMDPASLLLSGPAAQAGALLNAVRALRQTGGLEADWAPEPLLGVDLRRRAPGLWVRVNPARASAAWSPAYRAVFTAPPPPEANAAIAGAAALFATSPRLAALIRKLAPAGRAVTLWRPALSAAVWTDFKPASGLNTKPRVLWFDEGIAPAWLESLINETLGAAAWIVVERAGASYTGAVARIPPQTSEQGWAAALAELAPHILVRPAGSDASGDHYPALLAAAAGCHLLVDDRLDLPGSLGALRLPNRLEAWVAALGRALTNLTGTLAKGAAARAAALALPAVEAAAPPWARFTAHAALRTAAE